MESEDSQPRSQVGSLITLVATVVFLMYGGYLLLVSFRVGIPGEEPFIRYNLEIAKLTVTVMDTPFMTWVIGYAAAGLLLCLQSRRPAVGWLMTIVNLLIAGMGLLILYGVYLGVTVLPGVKIMMELGLE